MTFSILLINAFKGHLDNENEVKGKIIQTSCKKKKKKKKKKS